MATLRRLWNSNAPLTAGGLLMLAVLAASLVGLRLDPRVITGMPAWLKPAKFAASTAIYMFTLAWIFSHLPGWPRVRRTVGWMTAVLLVGEVALIDLQAWRGTTSHFNIGTPLDAVVFATMGLGILVQTGASAAVTIALWRQPFADRAFGWALRFGMAITLLGASTGGLMTRPTSAQLADARLGHRTTAAGAHRRRAGRRSRTAGHRMERGSATRVPHFVGLHAMQMLPLLAWGIAGLIAEESARLRLVWVAAGATVCCSRCSCRRHCAASRSPRLLQECSPYSSHGRWAPQPPHGSPETKPRPCGRRVRCWGDAMTITPETVFSIANPLALVGWILLVVLPRQRWVAGVACAWVIPGILAATYVIVIATHILGSPGGFSSLPAVEAVCEPVAAARGLGPLLRSISSWEAGKRATRASAACTWPSCRVSR
jgi:hypothetical protein